MSFAPLVNDAYFIIAGIKSGEGAVIARNRNDPASTWTLKESISVQGNGFFMLETNYDYDKPVPKADDRLVADDSHVISQVLHSA